MLTHYWPDEAAKVISGAEVITAMKKVIAEQINPWSVNGMPASLLMGAMCNGLYSFNWKKA